MNKINIKFNDVTDVNKFVHIMDLRNRMWMTGNCEPNEASQIIRELGDVVAA